MGEDLFMWCGPRYSVVFDYKRTKCWVRQPKAMSALEKKKDIRASLKQKRKLGSPLLGLGWVSDDGANCGEYRALAVPGSSIRCQPLRVCLCGFWAVHFLTRLFAHSPCSSRDSGKSRPAVRLPSKPDLVTLSCNFSSAKQCVFGLVAGSRWSSVSALRGDWSRQTICFRSHLACRQHSTAHDRSALFVSVFWRGGHPCVWFLFFFFYFCCWVRVNVKFSIDRLHNSTVHLALSWSEV